MPMVYHPVPPPPPLSLLCIYLYNPSLIICLSITPLKPREPLNHLTNQGGLLRHTPHSTITHHFFCTHRIFFHLFFLNGIIIDLDPNTMVSTFSETIQQDSPFLNTQPQTTVQVDLYGPIHVRPSHYFVLPSCT